MTTEISEAPSQPATGRSTLLQVLDTGIVYKETTRLYLGALTIWFSKEQRFRYHPEEGLQVEIPQDDFSHFFSRATPEEIVERLPTSGSAMQSNTGQQESEDQSFVWWLAQCLHYALPFVFTVTDAQLAFQQLVQSHSLRVPKKMNSFQKRLKKEYRAQRRADAVRLAEEDDGDKLQTHGRLAISEPQVNGTVTGEIAELSNKCVSEAVSDSPIPVCNSAVYTPAHSATEEHESQSEMSVEFDVTSSTGKPCVRQLFPRQLNDHGRSLSQSCQWIDLPRSGRVDAMRVDDTLTKTHDSHDSLFGEKNLSTYKCRDVSEGLQSDEGQDDALLSCPSPVSVASACEYRVRPYHDDLSPSHHDMAKDLTNQCSEDSSHIDVADDESTDGESCGAGEDLESCESRAEETCFADRRSSIEAGVVLTESIFSNATSTAVDQGPGAEEDDLPKKGAKAMNQDSAQDSTRESADSSSAFSALALNKSASLSGLPVDPELGRDTGSSAPSTETMSYSSDPETSSHAPDHIRTCQSPPQMRVKCPEHSSEGIKNQRQASSDCLSTGGETPTQPSISSSRQPTPAHPRSSCAAVPARSVDVLCVSASVNNITIAPNVMHATKADGTAEMAKLAAIIRKTDAEWAGKRKASLADIDPFFRGGRPSKQVKVEPTSGRVVPIVSREILTVRTTPKKIDWKKHDPYFGRIPKDPSLKYGALCNGIPKVWSEADFLPIFVPPQDEKSMSPDPNRDMKRRNTQEGDDREEETDTIEGIAEDADTPSTIPNTEGVELPRSFLENTRNQIHGLASVPTFDFSEEGLAEHSEYVKSIRKVQNWDYVYTPSLRKTPKKRKKRLPGF